MIIIAIDPGTLTGLAVGPVGDVPVVHTVDFTPRTATKGRKATKNSPAIPGRTAEQRHIRYGKLWTYLQSLVGAARIGDEVRIVCEDAAGFMRGKAAIEVSNKFRGVVEAFAAVHDIPYESVQPNDLKRFATGKAVAEKFLMIAVAKKKYGYLGDDDNEADALLLWHFICERDYKDVKSEMHEESDFPGVV